MEKIKEIEKLREKIEKKQMERDSYKHLTAFYRQKGNHQFAVNCELKYGKLCKTCAKLVEKYYNLLQSNNGSYAQLSLFSYFNNNNNNI